MVGLVGKDGFLHPISSVPLSPYDIGREWEREEWQKKIDLILNEIPNMAHWQSADGQDLVMAYDVIRLIKETIDGEC